MQANENARADVFTQAHTLKGNHDSSLPSYVNIDKYPSPPPSRFMRVEEVCNDLGCSESYAFAIMRKLNKELEEKGYFTMRGRVLRKYYYERTGAGL